MEKSENEGQKRLCRMTRKERKQHINSWFESLRNSIEMEFHASMMERMEKRKTTDPRYIDYYKNLEAKMEKKNEEKEE